MPRTSRNPEDEPTPGPSTKDAPQGNVASVAAHCEPSDQWLASLSASIMDKALDQLGQAEREQQSGDRSGCAASVAAARALRFVAKAVEEIRKG